MTVFQIHPGSISIDQTVAQWLGKLSNCNVVAQSFSNLLSLEGYAFRLLCTECKSTLPLLEWMDIRINNEVVAKFCREHRHEPMVFAVDEAGRKFREEN